ncbi:MAG TPA: hypothetical protein VMV08_05520 [Gaiellaceae bacterium]|nr:hypothetical protein [Gaiellaceae bacterium]
MAAIPGTATVLASSGGGGIVNGEPVVITLPVEGYEHVARLVTGGLASRLEFGFETVDDIQLAIELVLRSIPAREATTTVSFLQDGRSLSVEIEPVAGLTLEQPLRALDGGGMGLGASLERLVDTVELRAGPEPVVVLGKTLPGQP